MFPKLGVSNTWTEQEEKDMKTAVRDIDGQSSDPDSTTQSSDDQEIRNCGYDDPSCAERILERNNRTDTMSTSEMAYNAAQQQSISSQVTKVAGEMAAKKSMACFAKGPTGKPCGMKFGAIAVALIAASMDFSKKAKHNSGVGDQYRAETTAGNTGPGNENGPEEEVHNNPNDNPFSQLNSGGNITTSPGGGGGNLDLSENDMNLPKGAKYTNGTLTLPNGQTFKAGDFDKHVKNGTIPKKAIREMRAEMSRIRKGLLAKAKTRQKPKKKGSGLALRDGGGGTPLSADEGSSRRRRRNRGLNSLDGMSGIRAGKKKAAFEGMAVKHKNNHIGIEYDNIFDMVHRRYQSQKAQSRFFEDPHY